MFLRVSNAAWARTVDRYGRRLASTAVVSTGSWFSIEAPYIENKNPVDDDLL
jgi:ABC-type Fe2+-enterobactin transport system substrate-binding protein